MTIDDDANMLISHKAFLVYSHNSKSFGAVCKPASMTNAEKLLNLITVPVNL